MARVKKKSKKQPQKARAKKTGATETFQNEIPSS